MKGDYPRFKAAYVHEELVEHFLLSPVERALVETCHGETNRHSVAVLLKTVQYLGYFPEDLQHVPPHPHFHCSPAAPAVGPYGGLSLAEQHARSAFHAHSAAYRVAFSHGPG